MPDINVIDVTKGKLFLISLKRYSVLLICLGNLAGIPVNHTSRIEVLVFLRFADFRSITNFFH